MSVTSRGLKYFRLFCVTILIIGVSILFVAVGRTLSIQDIDLELGPYDGEDHILLHEQFQKFLKIFGGAVKFKTVSLAPGNYDRDEIYKFQKFLRNSFPLVFSSSHIEVETVNNYSLLLSVKGHELTWQPYLLASHMDVVSVDPDQWMLDPFLGEVVADPLTGEDVVWGRGTIDDKIGVIGILSALELLLKNRWKPKRSFYVAFGHDEEVSGADGAGNIAIVLSQKNVSLEFILDEGMPITHGVIKGVNTPVASIAVAEKGKMGVEVTVEAIGGHSSIPPQEQATGILAGALHRIYSNPKPSMFGLGPEVDMFRYLAPKVSWPYKLVFANTWLFGPILEYMMSRDRLTDAVIRTTTANTIIKAGVQENVVPATAWANIDHRVHPAQSLDDVLAHDSALVGDSRVKLKMVSEFAPSPISPYGPDCLPFKLIVGALKHSFPDAIPVPCLMLANTDTHNYLNLSKTIYRFFPVNLSGEELATIHGKNERLSVKNFRAAILFYRRLIQLSESSTIRQKFLSTREAGEL